MYKDQPENVLSLASNKALFIKHPMRMDIGGTPKSVRRITKDEDRVKGKLKGNVYATYFRNNGGACFVITLLLILILWQGLKCGADLWLVKWKGDEED